MPESSRDWMVAGNNVRRNSLAKPDEASSSSKFERTVYFGCLYDNTRKCSNTVGTGYSPTNTFVYPSLKVVPE